MCAQAGDPGAVAALAHQHFGEHEHLAGHRPGRLPTAARPPALPQYGAPPPGCHGDGSCPCTPQAMFGLADGNSLRQGRTNEVVGIITREDLVRGLRPDVSSSAEAVAHEPLNYTRNV